LTRFGTQRRANILFGAVELFIYICVRGGGSAIYFITLFDLFEVPPPFLLYNICFPARTDIAAKFTQQTSTAASHTQSSANTGNNKTACARSRTSHKHQKLCRAEPLASLYITWKRRARAGIFALTEANGLAHF
jgi:hypothetical protein